MQKILVIDDEKAVLTLCRYILEKQGFNISLAATRTEAEKYLSRETFDIIICDCTLGVYIGENLIDRILKTYSEIGIIVISGYFYSSEIEELIKKGAFRCVSKPFKHQELLSAVTDYIETRGNNIPKKIGALNNY